MQVRAIMSPSPLTLEATATLADAVELMGEHGVRHVPIVDNGSVVGIVSDRDVKMALGPDARELDIAAIDPRLGDGPLDWFMSDQVQTVAPDDHVSTACARFIDLKVGALAVVENDEQVGIISVVDVLGAALPLLQSS